jgi:hypothetical protein
VYLARCRDRRGWYRHDGLATTHDARAVHTALLWAHESSFQQWLELPAWDQHDDLSEYLTGLNRSRALAAWSDSEPWHAIAPPTAEPHERDLFAADFRALLRVLGASDRQGRKGKS